MSSAIDPAVTEHKAIFSAAVLMIGIMAIAGFLGCVAAGAGAGYCISRLGKTLPDPTETEQTVHSQQPPDESVWRSEVWCLDAEAAYRQFFGLTLDSAQALFVNDAMCREEDLMFMPAPCFRYYLPAYMNYLMSDESAEDADGASCFFRLIDHRMDDVRVEPSLTKQTIETVNQVAGRQQWYQADESIYGSFEERARGILAKLNKNA